MDVLCKRGYDGSHRMRQTSIRNRDFQPFSRTEKLESWPIAASSMHPIADTPVISSSLNVFDPKQTLGSLTRGTALMIARQIGVVLCRVGAAVLTVQAIRSLGYTIPGFIFDVDGFGTEALAFGLLSVVPGLAAIGLWVFAERISSVVNQPDTTESQQPLTGVDLVRIGTALIGIYVLIMGVISGTSVEVGNLARPDLDTEFQSMMDQHYARLTGYRVSYLAQIVIGAALILGRDRISAVLAKAKYAGVDTR